MAVVGFVTVLGLALLAPSCASAHFTRPFLRQITGTPTGEGGSEVPFIRPGGVAIDAAGNLWVGDEGSSLPFKLDQFEYPLDAFLNTLSIEGMSPPAEGLVPPGSLAIDRSTGSFYVAGGGGNQTVNVEVFAETGTFLKRFGPVGSEAQVAIDNSSEPSAGTVYVAAEGSRTISKFDASGKQANYSASASYIEGNKITGTPNGGNFEFESPKGIAVDSRGNLYAADPTYKVAGLEEPAVVEYGPSGEFVRALFGKETPGLGEDRNQWGGHLKGVAIDPSDGHLLVSISKENLRSGGELVNGEGAVDEFDSAGRFLDQITETEVEVSPDVHQRARLQGAFEMTVDPHGDLYVVDKGPRSDHTEEHAVDVYGPGRFLPSFRLAEASGRHPTVAVLNGFVNAEGAPLAACAFEYVTEAAYKENLAETKEGFSDLSSGGQAACAPPAGSIPADESFHSVHAEVTEHITSGTTYRYRLTATATGELGGTEHSDAVAFTAPGVPAIESTSISNLSSTFADLDAQIDPRGADTSYHFEYLTAAAYRANGESFSGPESPTSVPVTPADVGSGGPTGSSSEGVLQQIGGLAPGTVYYFRAIAGNEVGVTVGPNETFASLPQVSPGLPDHRAYELVTPPNKGEATDMFGAGEPHQNEFENADTGSASESGDAFLLSHSLAAFGPFPAASGNAYLFKRTETGWQATSLVLPTLGVQNIEDVVFDPSDFSQVGVNDIAGADSSATGAALTTLLGPVGGPYTVLHADSPTHGRSPAEAKEVTKVVGGSHDLSHIVLESKNHTLCPGDEGQEAGSTALCEYSAGEFTLVNANSKGKLSGRFACGAVLGESRDQGNRHNAVSADGSRVFFTSPDPYAKNDGPGCWNGETENAPQLYMRHAGSTVQVSAPETGVTGPTCTVASEPRCHSVVYVGASEDGSKVFFVTRSELTKDDEGIHDPELYEYDTETARLTRVSRGESGKDAANIADVPAISADGSIVYFTATAQLTAKALPTSGEQVDLYRYNTETGATVFVAMVGKGDYRVERSEDWGERDEGGSIALASYMNWYTTPDGRYLLFASTHDLTGYSTAEASPGDCTDERSGSEETYGYCDEVYRYDSQTASLACLSCNPSGTAPTSNAEFAQSAALNSTDPASGPVRAISDDGSYAFFETADPLVPEDANGTYDVYEWHEGKVSLISSGQDSAPSFFVGAGADGSNVFFGTHARLVPQDTDNAGDLYDARICTETSPCIKPPAGETAQCEGDACQIPPAPPSDASPSSLTFSGPGNLVSALPSPAPPKKKAKPRCARGKKLSHGRCVRKKRSKKARRASRHGRLR